MDRDKVLKESIRRLLRLRVSDDEIIKNLESVGIDPKKAERLIEETKSGVETPAEKDSASNESDSKEKDYDISEKISADLVGETPNEAPQSIHKDKSVSELWEKGILSTVNARFNEMQKMKEEIDKRIDEKVEAKVSAESKKISTVLQSQRDLFYVKIEAYMKSKTDEMKKTIEARASHLEDVNATVQEKLLKTQGEKRLTQELIASIGEKTAELDTLQDKILADSQENIKKMNSVFEKSMVEWEKSKEQADERINHSLDLESQLTEGMITEMRQKIETLSVEKEQELKRTIQLKIKELDDMTAQVDPKGIAQKMEELTKFQSDLRTELEEFKDKVSQLQDENIEELRKEYAANMDDLFSKSLVLWDKKLKKKESEIDALKEKIDEKKFDAMLESLDLFKQQFVNTVQKNISEYNKSKEELAKMIIERDKKVDTYIKKIDSKVKSLTEFEKTFSEEVNDLLARIPDDKIIKPGPASKMETLNREKSKKKISKTKNSRLKIVR